MNNIYPIYEAILDREMDGIFGLSLVSDPAVESNFLAFAKEEKKDIQLFSVENEEKRMVTGVVMRADFPIIRVDDAGNYYYLTFSRKTIEEMSRKLFSDGAHNTIDLQHDFNYIEGVEMVECFIKDTEKGISPKGFEDITDGSLFATYKILDDAVWSAIKDGTFKGFSLEGYFSYVPVKTENKVTNIKTKMSKLFKTIRKAFVAFAEINTDKGTLSYAGDEDIKVGDEVFVENEDGEAVPAEDGEYKAEGCTIVVAEGKVAEIREDEVEEPATEEPKEDEPVEAEDEETEEPKAEETEEPATEEPKEDEVDPLDEIRKEIEGIKADIEAIKQAIAELVEKPAAEPIEEEFEKVQKKDAKMSRAERIASYLR